MGDRPLLRSAGGEAEFRERVEAGLVAELGTRSVTAVIALVCLLPFLPEVLGGAAEGSAAVRASLRVLWVVVVVRLGAILVLRLVPGPRLPTRKRKGLLVAGSTLVAAGFATLNLAAVPRLDDAHAALLAVCHAGIGSVALVSMAGSLGGYLVYLALNLGSLLVAVAVDGSSPVRRLLVALVVLFIASLAALAVNVHRGLRRSLLLALQLEEAALRDSLTGLRNRRSLADAMAVLSGRILAAWSSQPGGRRPGPRESLSILVLDLDHFKEVNDRYSHAAGDTVLVELASRLRAHLRREDLVVRWGGEEFVVVVAGPGRDDEPVVAERIREVVSASPFRLPNGLLLPVTCSVGSSVFPFSAHRPDALSWEEVLNVADLALRTAKQRGRDRSVGITCGEGALDEPQTARSLVDGYLERAQEQGLVRITLRAGEKPRPA